MMYFTLLGQSNMPGNSLQKQALAVLQAESNLLINNADAFVKALGRQITNLNGRNPRCKPLIVSTYKALDSIGIYLGSNYTVSFHLYPVKNGATKEAA